MKILYKKLQFRYMIYYSIIMKCLEQTRCASPIFTSFIKEVVRSERCLELTRCTTPIFTSFIEVVGVDSEKEAHIVRLTWQLKLLIALPQHVGQIARTPARSRRHYPLSWLYRKRRENTGVLYGRIPQLYVGFLMSQRKISNALGI